jgi:hypothetical protein
VLESVLRATTNEFIDVELRKSISVILEDLLTRYGSELLNTFPETDDKKFNFITDGNEVTRSTLEKN